MTNVSTSFQEMFRTKARVISALPDMPLKLFFLFLLRVLPIVLKQSTANTAQILNNLQIYSCMQTQKQMGF